MSIEAFDLWWESDGRYIDPDSSDVPWFYKRKELAADAFKAGIASAMLKPTNCQNEPPFPSAETVLFAGDSSMCAHKPSAICALDYPHQIVDCGEFE